MKELKNRDFFFESHELQQDLKMDVWQYIHDMKNYNYETVTEQIQAEQNICRSFVHLCTRKMLKGKTIQDVIDLIGNKVFNVCYRLYCESFENGTFV